MGSTGPGGAASSAVAEEADHDGNGGGMPESRSRSEGSGSGSEESGVTEARRRWLLGRADEDDDDGSGGVSEEAEGGGESARAAPLFERLPLGLPCRRGSDSQALWLVCNDDVLLGRADNGERGDSERCKFGHMAQIWVPQHGFLDV